ncbi:MAG: TolB family protein [Gemmatimonadales bacterium]
MRLFLFPLTLWVLAGCEATLPPLRGKLEVGRDAYAVFVGGNSLNSDLYAVRADGGPASPLTYTPVAELAPALAPDGGSVAFLRAKSLRDSTPASVWILNLLSGADRELRLPKGAGAPRRLGWYRDGTSVVVATERGLYLLNPPPARTDARPVPPPERQRAESSLAVLLGDPVFGRVVPCEKPEELCVMGDSGAPGFLVRGAHDPLRWGPDSVAFLLGNRLEIRPLARGRPRRLTWSNLPENPRQVTFFEGRKEMSP